MAEIVPITVHADGLSWKVRLVFRSRLLRLLPIGGLCLSRSTVRFKRDRRVIPLWLVGHELRHTVQARRLGWRYLPAYLLDWVSSRLRGQRPDMESDADFFARAWATNGQPWEAPAYPIPRAWHAYPASRGPNGS